MNFKGFNTTGSRETCQFAGNSPTVHSQKEDGTDGKPTERPFPPPATGQATSSHRNFLTGYIQLVSP